MKLEIKSIEAQGEVALELLRELHSIDNPREKKEAALSMLRKLLDGFIWNDQINSIATEPLGLLVTNQQKIELMAKVVGIDTSLIPWYDVPDLSWHEVLKAAYNQGLTNALIETVLNYREKITLTDEERNKIIEMTGEIGRLVDSFQSLADLTTLQQLTDELSRLVHGI